MQAALPCLSIMSWKNGDVDGGGASARVGTDGRAGGTDKGTSSDGVVSAKASRISVRASSSLAVCVSERESARCRK